MPSIPSYNQSETEEAVLTRAKKRILKVQKKGVKMMEVPVDGGVPKDADGLAERMIVMLEDLIGIFQNMFLYFDLEGGEVRNEEDARKILRYLFLAYKLSGRVWKLTKSLLPVVGLVDASLFRELQGKLAEFVQMWNKAKRYFEVENFEGLNNVANVADIFNDDQPPPPAPAPAKKKGRPKGGKNATTIERERMGEEDVRTNARDIVSSIISDLAGNVAGEVDADLSQFGTGMPVLPADNVGMAEDPLDLGEEEQEIDADIEADARIAVDGYNDYLSMVRRVNTLVEMIKNALEGSLQRFKINQVPEQFPAPMKGGGYSVGGAMEDKLYAVSGLPRFL